MNYEKETAIFKALSDVNRLKIIDMLSCSCDEMCACRILENFSITQPTLSHHMKVLCDVGIVDVRKEGPWNYYSLNRKNILQITNFIDRLVSDKGNCECDFSRKEYKVE